MSKEQNILEALLFKSVKRDRWGYSTNRINNPIAVRPSQFYDGKDYGGFPLRVTETLTIRLTKDGIKGDWDAFENYVLYNYPLQTDNLESVVLCYLLYEEWKRQRAKQ